MPVNLCRNCVVFAQDRASNNPFSTPDTPPAGDQGDQPSAELLSMPEINPSLPESSQLIIRAVIESKPSTPIELAKAIRTLMDIEAYDHARFFLNQLVGFRPDDRTMFELESTMGSGFLMGLYSNDNMQPLGRSFAESASAAASRAAYDPQRFEQLISTLSDENISVRSEAYRALRRLGAAAAARLLNVFADPAREQEFPFIRGALNNFGDEAIEPLIGAARARICRFKWRHCGRCTITNHSPRGTRCSARISRRSSPSQFDAAPWTR